MRTTGPLKVWHIIDTLEVGGAETVVSTLCREQRRAGLEPSVYSLVRGGGIADELRDHHIPVQVLGYESTPPAAWQLARLMRASRPDVVHCHNDAATVAGAVAAWSAGTPAVLATKHGMSPPGVRRRSETQFWIAARCCRFVVAVSRTSHQNLARGPLAQPHKLVTIFNGAAPAAVAKPVPLNPAGFHIVNVARHTAVKDLATLLRAFAIVVEKAPESRLLLAGHGVLTGELKRLAADLNLGGKVEFLGERRDVGSILAASQLFVLSSVSEGLPISLLEAMAARLPQVVTDVGGMPEIVKMSGGGTVVPPRDPVAMSAAILRFRDDNAYRAQAAERSFNCYSEHFTPGHMMKQYEHLYRSGKPR